MPGFIQVRNPGRILPEVDVPQCTVFRSPRYFQALVIRSTLDGKVSLHGPSVREARPGLKDRARPWNRFESVTSAVRRSNMLRSGELAQQAGVSSHTLRRCERLGSLRAPAGAIATTQATPWSAFS